MNDTHRPVTSKARGICKYYTEPRGCFAGNKCKFLHTTEAAGDPSGSRPALTPYDQSKRCKFYAEGFCKRGDKCWFLHAVDKQSVNGSEAESDDEELCSICFEKPSTYGLLGGCSHIFCLECIRQWRDPAGKGSDISNTKKCPMCRAKCRYIIPSSRFLKDGQTKTQVVQNYKDSMSKVSCMHFEKSKAKHPKKPPLCPFGKECFYRHLNADGTSHVLKDGVAASMRAWKSRMRGSNPHTFSFMNEAFLDGSSPFLNIIHPEGSEAELQAMNIAGSIALTMFDQMVADVMETNTNGRGRGRGRGTNGRGRSRRDQGRLGEAEMEMAMSAIRAQLHRIDDSRNQEDVHPMVVPGTLAPSSNWDLEAEGEGPDNGWGWDDLTPGANPAGDIDLMGQLELMADHMLLVRGQDNGSPPPPLEPIGRGNTPPPPLEPIGDRAEGPQSSLIPMGIPANAERDDDDEMPDLESVSNSSESEDSDSDNDQDSDYSEHDTTDRVDRAERVFDFAFRPTQRTQHDTPFRPRNSPSHLPDNASSRFSTTVARDEINVVDTDDEGDADDEDNAGGGGDASPSEDDSDAQSDREELPPVDDLVLTTAAEPPFVTDGRGRVVWSNKSTTRQAPAEAPLDPTEETERSATGSRSLLGRPLTPS